MYRTEFAPRAKKALDRLPKRDGDRIAVAIAALATGPRDRAEKISGAENLYRIRVGSFRVIFEIAEATKLVVILKVARRSETTYRKL